ncbi:MAG: hypothetical protein P8Y53_21910 [Pseudolabrys sp.]|jgi:hypothetical protein
MGTPLALIRELNGTIAQASDLRRAAMLRHLTDLYLVSADGYSDEEIAVVDDVFVCLVATIEESSCALVAMGDAPLALVEGTVGTGNAETIVMLARAIDLPWETTKNIISMAARRHQRPNGDIDKSLAAFRRLKQSTAQ